MRVFRAGAIRWELPLWARTLRIRRGTTGNRDLPLFEVPKSDRKCFCDVDTRGQGPLSLEAGSEEIGEFTSSDHGRRFFCKQCGSTLGNLTTRWQKFFNLAAGRSIERLT